LPWALKDVELRGTVLEVGAGSGAMAYELLQRHPGLELIATDIDPAMVQAATDRLAVFGERVSVAQADATSLAVPTASVDVAAHWLMLHHTLRWEAALEEAVRVLRPGGWLVGYDLLDSRISRAIHRLDGSDHRLVKSSELSVALRELQLEQVRVSVEFGGHIARWVGQKPA